ncbi:MAG: phenylalanine--tRNA ligase subunit beta [Desulfobacteraceae bacterium]|nr:phenylalanine--tRNA ligase subunit beta [Desulfobacteraceae bacterium]
MKVSLSWLSEYVPVQMPVDQLAHMLTMTGLEVEGVEDRYAYLAKVVVARIAAVAPHPNADKLKLCTVQAGGTSFQVVCGAPNAAQGMLAPLALPGCELLGGMTVKEGEIRGQRSQGMLCSQAELGLGPDRAGLMALDPNLTDGQALNRALGLSDMVLEVSLTPNRADCLSLIGIAREIAGFQGVRVKRPKARLPKARGRIEDLTSVTIQSPEHCPRYAARLVENVKVGPSPFWLQDRLNSVGLRPINNIVDVTNYIMMETGQPLHAFDFDHLAENRIVVRTAAEGEFFTTLDGKERRLNSHMLMICDGQRPVAVGGVMGGLNSEIETGTSRVLIESAYFNPISIRKTAKVLGLKTDASHRFERGVDPQGTLYALDRCAQLITQLARGRLVEGCIDVKYDLPQAPAITLSVAAANRLLGTGMPRAEMARLLNAIEFKAKAGKDNTLLVEVPSFRVDVSRPEDLMEEVARRAGYDQIPVTFPAMSAEGQAEPKLLSQRRRIRDLLTGMGFTEAINYSFIHPDSCRRLRLPESDARCRQLAVLNPLSEDQAVMRTSLVPGLLETMKRNMARQNRNLKLFETGKIFISNGSNAQPDEIEMLAGLWTGDRAELHWDAKSEPCDFYDLKGAVEGLLDGLRLGAVRFTRLDKAQCFYTQPGASAQILCGEDQIGLIGQVHPQVLAAYDLRQEVFIFELEMLRLGAHIPEATQSQPLPKYPSTTRDLSLIVNQDLEADALLAHVRRMDEPLMEEVRLVAVFSGQPIATGRKSVSLRMVYRSAETTLEDATVNELHMRIASHLMEHFKAQLQGQ